jgi:hypothetical protein
VRFVRLRSMSGGVFAIKLFFYFLSSIKNINQLPVSTARCQHRSQIWFETVSVKNYASITNIFKDKQNRNYLQK